MALSSRASVVGMYLLFIFGGASLHLSSAALDQLLTGQMATSPEVPASSTSTLRWNSPQANVFCTFKVFIGKEAHRSCKQTMPAKILML